ncbi:mycoredoxin [Nakamurella endophytica]|uniref:Glutaredoxin-like protein n=1 Tax=Nakamurella endophytica TaxID=1748367 RepID=A0A917SW16_9ACTN|nr:mycoredoxin [Nakamurella endophytica]GGM00486.1 putative glutaredoxin-like protein [Nakamurella endophytica]
MTTATEIPTVYLTSWCPFCRRLETELRAAGVEYRAVDVDEDLEAGELVMSLNGGNRVVPTVVFADGSSLTNPPARQVVARLG